MATNSPAKSTRSSLSRNALGAGSADASGHLSAQHRLAETTRSVLQAKLAAAKPVHNASAAQATSDKTQQPAAATATTAGAGGSAHKSQAAAGATGSNADTGVALDVKTIENIAQALHSKSLAAREQATPVARQNGETGAAAKVASNGAVEEKLGASREDTSSSSSSDDSSEFSTSAEGEEKKEEPRPPSPPQQQAVVMPPKKKRGRPRKYPLPPTAASAPTTPSSARREDGAAVATTSMTPGPSGAGKRATKPPIRLQMSAASDKMDDDSFTEMDGDEKKPSKRRGRGCGRCVGCVRGDCGKCVYCKDKPKFGGPGRKKQRCMLRVCSNFVSVS